MPGVTFILIAPLYQKTYIVYETQCLPSYPHVNRLAVDIV